MCYSGATLTYVRFWTVEKKGVSGFSPRDCSMTTPERSRTLSSGRGRRKRYRSRQGKAFKKSVFPPERGGPSAGLAVYCRDEFEGNTRMTILGIVGRRRRRGRARVLVMAVAAMLLSACGSSSKSIAPSPTAAASGSSGTSSSATSSGGSGRKLTGTPIRTMTIAAVNYNWPTYAETLGAAKVYQDWVNAHRRHQRASSRGHHL